MSPTEPHIITEVRELRGWAEQMRAEGRRIALVPTMGALHEGHLSLVRLAHARADRVVVSIFVNPTQFGPNEDLKHYPRDLASDLSRLRGNGVDVVFTPSVREMYPEGVATWVEVERLGEGMCGRHRPGHFRGVTTIVARLFNVARPHVAVFGEKDYQQLVVIRRMARDLLFDLEIVAGPTVREPDGLAMSSRNAYLTPEARQQARALNAALHEVRELVRSGELNTKRLVAAARNRIEKEPLAEIDYIEIRDAGSLEPLSRLDRRAVLGLAVRVAATRLIDNTILEAV
ncbi:MAG: pantoate--beta-alanine ligase [Deltaproteobacteria bacterium]|nr:pantoate--beta-alanine ligase [Deltaproteobacteria bacterium]